MYWAACFSDPAKQTNFWDMAMALANELAKFNIVVEKWDSSRQDWRQEGRLQGEAGRGQGLHESKGGHIQHTGCRSRRAQSRIRLRACRLPLKRLFSRH
jgi:hypothetical protein